VLPKAVVYCADEFEAAAGADCLLILTEWNQFRALALDRMRELLSQPVIIDLRNLYQPAKMAKAGFHYISVGRPDGVPAQA
jgi:UDPglucose 6-dehydrogenase